MKKVTFNDKENKIYLLYTWKFANQNARKSDWIICALDRMRFNNRIDKCVEILSPILKPEHRSDIYLKRFAYINQ